MLVPTLADVKARKNFYRDNFFRAVKALIGMLVLMIILLSGIGYFVAKKPLEDFYSTNSIGLIEKLTPMEHPNYSAEYLLPPDPPSESDTMSKDMDLDTSTS